MVSVTDSHGRDPGSNPGPGIVVLFSSALALRASAVSDKSSSAVPVGVYRDFLNCKANAGTVTKTGAAASLPTDWYRTSSV